VVGGRAMGALPKLYRPPACCVFRSLPPMQSRPPASPSQTHTSAHRSTVPAMVRRCLPGRCRRVGSGRITTGARVPGSEAHATWASQGASSLFLGLSVVGNRLPQTVQTSHEHVMQTRGACLLLQYVPLDETVEAADVGLQTLGHGSAPCVSTKARGCQTMPGHGRPRPSCCRHTTGLSPIPLPPKDG
jgi:hypothetical protein